MSDRQDRSERFGYSSAPSNERPNEGVWQLAAELVAPARSSAPKQQGEDQEAGADCAADYSSANA